MPRLIVRTLFTVVLIYNFVIGIRQKEPNYEEFCPWMVLSALSIGLTFVPVDGFLYLVSCAILIVNVVQFIKELRSQNVEAGYCLHIIFAAVCIALWLIGKVVVLKILLILYCLLRILYSIYTIWLCPEERNTKLLDMLLLMVTLLLCIV